MKKLKTETDVLEAIGASNFRSIKKDNIISFVSNLSRIDKEVAISCIQQFPSFAESSTEIINQLKDVCNTMFDTVRIEDQEAIRSYQGVLDDLHYLLSKEDLSEDLHLYIIEKEIEVGDRIAEVVKRNKDFLKEIWQTIAGIAVGALAIAGGILGISLRKRD